MNSKLAILASLILQTVPFTIASDAPHAEGPTADEVLATLLEGNKRFVAGTATRPHQDKAYRASLAAGQKPIVAVLSCADSRVSPELLFDLGLGDVFVCRVAGNVVDDTGLGSLEYAVEHLHVPLIIVLGHEKCGAVKAAVDGGHADGHIGSLIEKIAPAVVEARMRTGEVLDNAVRANVQKTAKLVAVAEPIITDHIRAGKLKVVGARYDLDTGAVEIVPAAIIPVASAKPKISLKSH